MSTPTALAQLEQYTDLAAARLDGPVLAACPMSHRGMMSLKAAGHFGFLTRFATKQAYKHRAGGLPEHFVAAVTPTHVHVFDAPMNLSPQSLNLSAELFDPANPPGPLPAGLSIDPAFPMLVRALMVTGMSFEVSAVLLNLVALAGASLEDLIAHVRAIGEIIPIIGFYLQPAVGGQHFSVDFWRAFAGIESVIGIKIAPFNRYDTQDVLRGVAESGRAGNITLYTGNDDHIVLDLLSRFNFSNTDLQIKGGLLGHWAVWTARAAELHRDIRNAVESRAPIDPKWFLRNAEVTDMNAALFDVANHFHGCIAGINEVLRRQGLLAGRWCLDEKEDLSPGQAQELDRIIAAYPHLIDDSFIQENLDSWLK